MSLISTNQTIWNKCLGVEMIINIGIQNCKTILLRNQLAFDLTHQLMWNNFLPRKGSRSFFYNIVIRRNRSWTKAKSPWIVINHCTDIKVNTIMIWSDQDKMVIWKTWQTDRWNRPRLKAELHKSQSPAKHVCWVGEIKQKSSNSVFWSHSLPSSQTFHFPSKENWGALNILKETFWMRRTCFKLFLPFPFSWFR